MNLRITKARFWILWFIASALLAGFLSMSLLGEDKEVFLIGETTSGHHQIEMACEGCHVDAFGGPELLQEACEGCHLEELKAVRDSHPKKKFTDPSNADRIAILDARFCVTCHREHKSEITAAMGVTVPQDVCFHCHEDVGEDRESHKDLTFDSCGTSGCHNFHDNRALYESFLVENAGQADLLDNPLVASLSPVEDAVFFREDFTNILDNVLADTPLNANTDSIAESWGKSKHAAAQIDCQGCHQNEENMWVESPELTLCEGCHSDQSQGFYAGKHGMRLNAGLSPMTPSQARIPMHESAHSKELDCMSCHNDHEFNRQIAAIESCEGCHNSEHVTAYKLSPHAQITEQVFKGEGPEESAVTCATCHMPRETSLVVGQEVTQVQHNQNANLRPNDKMLRGVCMDCHSLAFSIDALADNKLIQNNFSGQPEHHIPSIDMAIERRTAVSDRDNTYR